MDPSLFQPPSTNPFRRNNIHGQPEAGAAHLSGMTTHFTATSVPTSSSRSVTGLGSQHSPGNPFRRDSSAASSSTRIAGTTYEHLVWTSSVDRHSTTISSSLNQSHISFDMSGQPNGLYTSEQLNLAPIAPFSVASNISTTIPIKAPEKPVLVAVMGLTGAGKSTFIKNITGRQDIVIGHSYRSETSKIQAYPVVVNGTNVTLLDTPGFNDTYISDEEVFKSISEWLALSYRERQLLSGIIYLHRTDIPRIAGSALKSIRMLELLCGDEACPNITLAMTGWEVLDGFTRQMRENELRQNDSFWKGMVSKGAKMLSLPRDCDAQKKLFSEMKFEGETTLQIQSKLNQDAAETVEDILAASGLNKHLAGLKIDHDEKAKTLDIEFKSQMAERETISQAETKRLEETKRKIEEQERKLKESEERMASQLREQAERHERELQAEKLRSNKMMEKMKAMEEAQRELLAKAESLANEQSLRTYISNLEEDTAAERPLTPLPVLEPRERISRMRNVEEQITEQEVMLLSAIECKVLRVNLDTKSTELRSYCDNCFKSLGKNPYLGCNICLDGAFACCAECYSRQGWCLDDDHKLYIRQPEQKSWTESCQRAKNPPGLGGLRCDVCIETIKGLYLHCCYCMDDGFDVCLNCVTDGKSCFNRSHILHYGVTPVLPL